MRSVAVLETPVVSKGAGFLSGRVCVKTILQSIPWVLCGVAFLGGFYVFLVGVGVFHSEELQIGGGAISCISLAFFWLRTDITDIKKRLDTLDADVKSILSRLGGPRK
ncbi:MAG: hypothetical protein AAB634_00880 [Patescibacteria group bacterium]|mgnify:FL=1